MNAALQYMDQSLIMAYELGNEVNLYGSEFRSADYDVDAYADQMEEWLPNLQSLSSEEVQFQFPSFAGPPDQFREDMRISVLVDMGVPQSIDGIQYYAVHGYPYSICTGKAFWPSRTPAEAKMTLFNANTFVETDADAEQATLTNFLDHQNILDLVDQYSGEISAAKSVGGTVHMGETGSVACHGKEGVSNTLGAALWELDFALTGASAGFDRFFFHNGQGDYYYSMWEPTGTDEHPDPYVNPT